MASASLEALQRMAKDKALSTHMAAGQYQQRPAAGEGGLFKREWFANPVKHAPEELRLVRAWNLASSVESNADYTVGLLMGKDPETELIYIIDVMRGRWSPGDVEIKIQSTARWDGEECQIWLPQDPGSAGKFQARYLAGKLQGYTVRTEAEAGDKEYRANPLAAQCEHGFVKLVDGT